MLAAVPNPDTPIFWTVGALAAGVVIGAMIVVVLVLHRRWVRPVRALAATASDLAGGEWNARVAVTDAADDVQRLGKQLNQLADEAQSRFAALQQQSANLKLLVDALPDAVLLSDERDRIVLINTPAERLLQLPPQQVVGRPFISAVSDPAILDLFEQCKRAMAGGMRPTRPLEREIKLMRRGQRLFFTAHAEPTANHGMLIVLRDISTLAATIQMKTDFVANASHELRTPISAIKVAFETLRDVHADDPPLTERCITIIDGHLRRLEEMLRDLLDLSRVESSEIKPHFAPVRLFDVLAVMRSTWLPVAREKGVELALPEGATEMEFISDRRLLDLVLKNLVENALKFTPAGGRVAVDITNGDELVVRVVDTGCGIPPEHMERVFERFYQVDNARSGTAGRGTGLGLAIVKHAVNALGGTIEVESEVGRGTRIACRLPRPE